MCPLIKEIIRRKNQKKIMELTKSRFFAGISLNGVMSFAQAVSGVNPLSLRRYDIRVLKKKSCRYSRNQWSMHSPFSCSASVNPFSPLNEDERVSRPSREKSYIVLEENGLADKTTSLFCP